MKQLLPIFLFLMSCNSGEVSPCRDACSLGQICDSSLGICVADTLRDFEGPTPGRGVSIASLKGEVFVAMIDPTTRRVLAGTLTPQGADLVELGEVSDTQKVVVRTSQSNVFVAWRAPNNRYRVASRQITASNSKWDFEELAVGTRYTGGDEFDFAVGQEKGMYLAFQASDRTLRLLSKSDAEAAYVMELVDAGGPSSNGISCPDALRTTDAPAGVGVGPSIAVNATSVAIVYQDADCGDLRLARRGEVEFGVDVVDTGSLSGEPLPGRRGRVGRHASARYEPDSGRLFIAYLDESRARLMLAISNDSGDFELEVVDTGLTLDAFSRQRRELVGAFAHLSFGSRGEPSISHMNTTEGEVRFSQRPSGGGLWFHKTLSDEGMVGFSANHAWVPELGLVVAAERLTPGDDGIESVLEVVWP